MSKTDENSEKNDESKLLKGNIIILDTNIPIDEPEIIDSIRTGLNANNLEVIPWPVMLELDKNKLRPGIRHEISDAVKRIKKALREPNSNLIIENRTSFSFGGLEKDVPDHQILATVLFISKQINDKKSRYYGYQKIKFITNDGILQTLAEHVFRQNNNVLIEPLLKNRIKEPKIRVTRKIRLGDKDRKSILDGATCLYLDKKIRLKENEFVMFISDFDVNGQSAAPGTHFLGIKKGNKLKIIRPDTKLYKQTALKNGKTNWPQVAAIDMLKDPSLDAVFLQGGAGSGKTFLALAGGLEAKEEKKFKKIVIMRLTVPLDSKFSTGTLPGDIEAKHAPWLLPIIDNLTALCGNSDKSPNKGYYEINFTLIEQKGIFIQPLDYIKGSSFRDTYIIVEESQDLTPRQIKQIMTRAGKGTKIVFTGDLGQISEDDRHISPQNSGLLHATSRLLGEPTIGIVTLENVVRSPLAALAERKL